MNAGSAATGTGAWNEAEGSPAGNMTARRNGGDMIELSVMEKLLTLLVQVILFVAVPWEITSRFDTVMVLIVLGVVSVAIVGGAEWFVEHVMKVELPG